MGLTVLTGGVRSGKSCAAVKLAADTGSPVAVAVAGIADGDPEMAARIDAHRRARPATWRVLEVAGVDPSEWLTMVDERECLIVDCIGTMLAALVWRPGEGDPSWISPATATEVAYALAEALVARVGETIVVTNEVGWGVVPPYPSGRAFADALSSANRMLVDAADRAFLVVCGRALDLKTLPKAGCGADGGTGGAQRRG